MSKIIVPRGPVVKRITLDIDKDGNIAIGAANLIPSTVLKGIQKPAMQPISALEVLFWLSKAVTDGLFQTMKNSVPGGGSDGNKEAAD